MKATVAVVTALISIAAFARGGRPGGGGGGGGSQPGGGGNQPDQPGGGSSFVYDTFLTDSTNVNGCIIYGNLLTGYVAGQSTVTIPATVTTIADGALSGNESVTRIDATAATGVVAIPESFASGCDSLSEISLPANVTTIGQSAFTIDSSLATFVGSGVTKVGDYAFFGCSSLVLPAENTYSEIGDSSFTGASLATEDGDVYAAEASSLVSWIKGGGSIVSSLSTRPTTYNTADLKTWLTNDVANLEAYLYASELATNANFRALSVSGTNFLFTAQDLATLSVVHAALQVSTDLSTWKTVSESDIVDGVYTMPSTTNGFARVVYSLTW